MSCLQRFARRYAKTAAAVRFAAMLYLAEEQMNSVLRKAMSRIKVTLLRRSCRAAFPTAEEKRRSLNISVLR